jgi:hypothetical protein
MSAISAKPLAKASAKSKNPPPVAKKPAKSVKVLPATPVMESKESKIKLEKPAALKKRPVADIVVKADSPKSARAAAAAESLSKLGQKWTTLFKKFNDSAIPYNVSGSYEAKTPIMHKVLGWGYVLANKNDRLEVLFRDGIKYLISNYKRD